MGKNSICVSDKIELSLQLLWRFGIEKFLKMKILVLWQWFNIKFAIVEAKNYESEQGWVRKSIVVGTKLLKWPGRD